VSKLDYNFVTVLVLGSILLGVLGLMSLGALITLLTVFV
jgi:hypothetical protein